MTNDEQLQVAQAAIAKFKDLPKDEQWMRLRRNGSVHADGSVQDWNAKLAVLEVRYDSSGDKAVAFTCLIPSGNMPGTAELEIRRENMEEYLREQSRVITATKDPVTGALDAGAEIHLTKDGSIRTDGNDTPGDNLGNLPRYSAARSRV